MAETIRIDPQEEGAPEGADARARARVGTLVAERYRLDGLLAHGERRAVYRAVHAQLRRRVVVKLLEVGAPPGDVARLEREAVACARVRHPNIAAATDAGQLPDGARFLVVDQVEGKSLREVMSDAPLPIARAIRIARRVASLLSVVHDEGIVHCDLQPSHVMLVGAEGDDVALVGFGAAKVDEARLPEDAREPGERERPVEEPVGLFASHYAPPEAERGWAELDARSDLHSLGVILYEMLSGKLPFTPEETTGFFVRPRLHAAPLPPELGVPAALEKTLFRLLDRDKSRRPATAREVVASLDAVVLGVLGDASGASRGAQALRLLMDAAARLASLAQTRLARRSVVPNWVVVAVASCIPLTFVVAWLIFRSSSSGPAGGDLPSPPGRADAVVASTAAPELPASSPGRTSATPAPETSGEAAASGLDANAARARLRDVAKTRDWARAVQAVEALVALDPAALRDPSVVAGIVSVAVAVETTGGADADAVFDALASRTGTDGLDILFEIVRTRGGTKGGKRAAELLRKPEIVAREQPALRIAFELRDAPCDKKPGLYERAVQEGDARTVTELRVLRAAECNRRWRRDDPCCFDHAALDHAISELRERLRE